MTRMSTAVHPLSRTAAQADAAYEHLTIHVERPAALDLGGGGPSPSGGGWTRCADVDAAFVAGWEARVAVDLLYRYGRSHPMTAAGFVLDWYATVPGRIGGAFYRLARRVPRLDRAALAFARGPEQHPVAVAVLDDRFWCLPHDPAADHPDATVVADEPALAAVLRAQVRTHADEFLARYRPGARLPRRSLLGAFFDGLDTGIWYGGDPTVAAAREILGAAAAVLPGSTAQFRDPSSIHRLRDGQGRDHLDRARVGCCQYFRVSPDGRSCGTCARTGPAERAAHHTARPAD